MENKKLGNLYKEQSKIDTGIKDIERYLEEAEVTEEYQIELAGVLKDLFEMDGESKELIKSKLNRICYALKKNQSEIELKKAIKRDLENSIKSMDKKSERLKYFLYYYTNKFFNVDEATLRLDWFSVGTGTTKDKLEIDNEKVKEYLKANGNQDWGRCFDNKYLVIRGGNALRTQECKIKEEKVDVHLRGGGIKMNNKYSLNDYPTCICGCTIYSDRFDEDCWRCDNCTSTFSTQTCAQEVRKAP